jgi:hypothetical protein
MQTSHQIIQGIVSAIDRTPNEIWWDIFDDLINVPMYFATTYTGNNWTRDAHESMESSGSTLYTSLERQRKVIGSVCRSWQLWSRSRKRRCAHMNDTMTTIGWCLDRALEARRVWILLGSWTKVQSALRGGVNWEILSAHPQLIANFPPISHSRIRRIRLIANDDTPSDSSIFLLALGRFKDITWLDYEISGTNSASKSIDAHIPRVTMPNLQVFYYRTSVPLQLPLSYITMPSLRYLAIHCLIRLDVPLNDIVLAYGQTLQSVIIRVHSIYNTTNFHAKTVRFPAWNKLPRLEELILSQRWSIRFQPIPPTHLLKKLVARHASFDALPSFLDAANMRQLLLLGASWMSAGRLKLDGNRSKVQDVSALEEKARRRGIRLAISRNVGNEDKFITRQEYDRLEGEAKKFKLRTLVHSS